MKTDLTPPLTDLSQSFERNGYCVVPNLISKAECAEFKKEALRLINEQKREIGPTLQLGVSTVSPFFYRFASDSRIIRILEQLMPDGVAFMSDKFVFSSGQHKLATPWHIDLFYWPKTRPKISVWIPLDDAMATNGTLKVIPHSHKRDWNLQQKKAQANQHNFIELVTEVEWKPEDELICELEKGGAIFFSDRLVHGSCVNEAGLDRYVIISTYHAPEPEEEFDKQFTARHVIIPRKKD